MKSAGPALGDNDQVAARQVPLPPVQPYGLANESLDPVAANGVPVLLPYRKAEAGMIPVVAGAEDDKAAGMSFHAPGVNPAEICRPAEVEGLWKREVTHGRRPKRTAAFFPSGVGGR